MNKEIFAIFMNKQWFFFIVVMTILVVLKSNKKYLIGKIGEIVVSRKLHKLNPAYYKILNDLVLPSQGNTPYTQIDHVVVSNYGIFCIETKAHEGWIFGDAYQKNWTQKIFKHTERFHNPTHQNFGHVKAIEGVVGLKCSKASVVPLVVFTSAGKLAISGTDRVGYARDVIKKIKSYTTPVYSDAERDEIVDLLKKANVLDKNIRREHIKEVARVKKE